MPAMVIPDVSQKGTNMKRKPTLPRPEKTVREWEADGWCYELCQRSNGTYVVYGADIHSDDWCVESASTIKAALAAVRQTPSEIDALLAVEEG